MDLRGLEAVVAVHENGSFSSAAAALFISQPALTRRVALLERELGVRLFVRSPRGAQLTDAGRALLAPARRALRETEAIRGAVEVIRNAEAGALSIVGAPNLSSTTLGQMIALFHDSSPEIEIRVVDSLSTADALAMVEAGVHDLALVDLPVDSGALSVSAVLREDFLAVLTPGTSNASQEGTLPTVTREMLDRRTMVHLPSSQVPQQRGMKLFEMVGADPSSFIEVSNCSLVGPIARSGRSVGLLPRAVAELGRADGLDLAVPPRPIRRTIGLARHRANRSPATTRFLKLARALAERSA